jgi:hypothetical protein
MAQRKIIVAKGEAARLAKDFKVESVTVWRALTFKRDTPQARMIRKAALERGGMEITVDGPRVSTPQ